MTVEIINKAVRTHDPPRKNFLAPEVTSTISGLIFAKDAAIAAISHQTASKATINISRSGGSANFEQYSDDDTAGA
jgi:hypothetical protein